MPRAWVYQDDHQVKKKGAAAASWYVGWIDPEGKRRCKSFGPGAKGKQRASQYQRKVEGELASGTYQGASRKNWAEFRAEYDEKILAGMAPQSRTATEIALKHFERVVNPVRVQAITSRTLAEYVAKRRTARGGKPGSIVSPATVNKELRHIRAVLKKAHRWGYLPKMPEFSDCFLKEPAKLPTYIDPDHFAAIYSACAKARRPDDVTVPAADWWRGLLVFAYMTGWRIGSILALRWNDVDLDEGTAITRAEDNKGRRDQIIPLHAVVVEHLRRVVSFSPVVFPWNANRRELFVEFERVQQAAGVKPQGKDRYGFHDLRRAFATMNADKLTPDALQALMQHRDYTTTQRYINMARQLKPSVAGLFVPDLPRVAAAGG